MWRRARRTPCMHHPTGQTSNHLLVADFTTLLVPRFIIYHNQSWVGNIFFELSRAFKHTYLSNFIDKIHRYKYNSSFYLWFSIWAHQQVRNIYYAPWKMTPSRGPNRGTNTPRDEVAHLTSLQTVMALWSNQRIMAAARTNQRLNFDLPFRHRINI